MDAVYTLPLTGVVIVVKDMVESQAVRLTRASKVETMEGKVDEHSCQCRSTNRHVMLGLFCMRKASLGQGLLTAFQAGYYAGCSP